MLSTFLISPAELHPQTRLAVRQISTGKGSVTIGEWTMHLGKPLRRAISIGLLIGLTHLTAGAATTVTLKHVHGLAFSQDGQQLSIPSHDGLALYRDGHWSKAPGPEHDYMGFSAGRQAIYSSGHPANGSGLVNPLGLIKSSDGGSTWQQLGF
jgi:hypothetical protein